MGFTDLDWRKEAPDVVERAIAICQQIKADHVGDYSIALRDLEPEFPYRHDLAVVVWQEIYRRRTPCWIYFAQVGDNLVKVGRSTKVPDRIATLSRVHGIEHKLLGTVSGDYREEWRAHRRFRKHRLKNLAGGLREYYELEPIAEIINDMIVAGEVLDAPSRWRQ
jgi:hypothetical protein